jgi:hypothetical protein
VTHQIARGTVPVINDRFMGESGEREIECKRAQAWSEWEVLIARIKSHISAGNEPTVALIGHYITPHHSWNVK